MSFRLLAINLIEERLNFKPSLVSKVKLFKFALNVQHSVKKEKRSVNVTTEISISPDGVSEKVGLLKVDFIYEIENLDSLISKKTGKVNFPDGFLPVLTSISVSTLRGIMFSRFKGTILGGSLLPIMDPKIGGPEIVAC